MLCEICGRKIVNGKNRLCKWHIGYFDDISFEQIKKTVFYLRYVHKMKLLDQERFINLIGVSFKNGDLQKYIKKNNFQEYVDRLRAITKKKLMLAKNSATKTPLNLLESMIDKRKNFY